MRKASVLTLLSIFIISGCTKTSRDTITQTSTINALLFGLYDGNITCKKLLTHGDFGIGTFDRLDGEMIVLDGRVFQVKSNGQVTTPSLEITTPFATVCNFYPDTTFQIDQKMNFENLEEFLDQTFTNQNSFYAIKIKGTFSRMKTRSVPAQEKPYPPLSEVAKNQPEFEFENIKGTLIGFRCPAFVKNINVPGYHLHFVDDDLSKGGHVLNFEIQQGWCEIDHCLQFFLILPEDADFQKADLSKDQTTVLMQVEK